MNGSVNIIWSILTGRFSWAKVNEKCEYLWKTASVKEARAKYKCLKWRIYDIGLVWMREGGEKGKQCEYLTKYLAGGASNSAKSSEASTHGPLTTPPLFLLLQLWCCFLMFLRWAVWRRTSAQDTAEKKHSGHWWKARKTCFLVCPLHIRGASVTNLLLMWSPSLFIFCHWFHT